MIATTAVGRASRVLYEIKGTMVGDVGPAIMSQDWLKTLDKMTSRDLNRVCGVYA